MANDRLFSERYGSVEPGLSKTFAVPELEPSEDPYNVAVRFLAILTVAHAPLSKQRLGLYYFLLGDPKRMSTLRQMLTPRARKTKPHLVPNSFSEKYATLRPWRQLYEDALAVLASRDLIVWEFTAGGLLFASTVRAAELINRLEGSVWDSVLKNASGLVDLLYEVDDHELRDLIARAFPELIGGKVVD